MPITASQVIRFSRLMTKAYAQAFTPITQANPLSMREVHILLFLANNPQYDTAKDVVQRRGLLKSQVSQGVETLCAQGFLERIPDSVDRRCTHLKITDQGRPVGQQAQHLQTQWWHDLSATFTPEEQLQTQILMQKMLDTAQRLEALL